MEREEEVAEGKERKKGRLKEGEKGMGEQKDRRQCPG